LQILKIVQKFLGLERNYTDRKELEMGEFEIKILHFVDMDE
jgi:hypothetical protein